MHNLQRWFQVPGSAGATAERYKLPLLCLWFLRFRTHCLGRLADTSLAEDLYVSGMQRRVTEEENLITTPSKLLYCLNSIKIFVLGFLQKA